MSCIRCGEAQGPAGLPGSEWAAAFLLVERREAMSDTEADLQERLK